MPKLPVLKSKQVISALLKAGFEIDRIKGSHYQFKKDNLRVTVPFHNRDLAQTTLKSILGQAKIGLEEFKKFL